MFDPQNPPEFSASAWLNAPEPRPLKSLKGRVVVLTAFQTHCPGSVKHGLPQAQRVAQGFSEDEVAVIGLNTAFEEKEKQTPEALQAFIAEHGLSFTVAKDTVNGGDMTETMAAYEIQGTPTTLIFDRQGRLRRHYLGRVDDIRLAAEVMAFCMEAPNAPVEQSMAVERRLAAALTDPDAHEHAHDGGCCGGHHNHSHDHDHDKGGGCGGH
jgi:peroxiredoxin